MIRIIYDRNFRHSPDRREVQQNEFRWKIGNELPTFSPHRVIELTVAPDSPEDFYLEDILGGSSLVAYYGDWARTVYLNMLQNPPQGAREFYLPEDDSTPEA